MADLILVGGGLAGSLLSVFLARHGLTVDVYERRPDMRKTKISAGRSINLALSTRGTHALKQVGLYDDIMKIAIPMKGRMVHPVKGDLMFQRYGRDDTEVIYATSRGQLNMALMSAAEACPGVRLHFHTRCTGMDLESRDVFFQHEESGETNTVRAETVIGTDGSASALRLEMQKSGRFNYSQTYLDYGYKELVIPAGPGGHFRIEKNALHIWPRTTFMLIALPNIDGSFTCTLFLPFNGSPGFNALQTETDVRRFFEEQFPDALPLMPTLLQDFFANPTGAMVTVKCSPWHVGGHLALLGDAAHAIVPFFGQGMNCAFEDCTVLEEILERRKPATGDRLPDAAGQKPDWEAIFKEYESARKVNTDAIADLAVENFVEMRDLVARPEFQLKKKVEQALQSKWPDRFVPKYSLVTFQRVPYSVALERGRIQNDILDELCGKISRPEEIDWRRADQLIRERLGV
jgi:kynurenine 3-monooxygenase